MTAPSAYALHDFIPDSLFSLAGNSALVIGAGGLGEVAAMCLSAAGARVAVADYDEQKAKQVARRIASENNGIDYFRVDVTEKAGVDRLFEDAIERMDRIHVAVVSMGITRLGSAAHYTEEDWDRVIDVNLKGTFLCCQAAGRHMIEKGGGSIINFSSITGQRAIKNTPAYIASKGGVDQLTKAMAIEWADHGIRVNAVAPSYFQTDLVAELQKDPENRKMFEARLQRVPMHRMGRPAELAGAITFLASSAASMVTGAIIPVDGGFLAA